MRYLLIDRILYLRRNSRIIALKNLALAEDVFANHFIGYPVMPGALLLEAAAQAGTALLEVSLDHEKKAILAMVERAKFRSMVFPGDQIQITGNLLSLTEDSSQVGIESRVGENLVMDAKLVFSLREPQPYYPDEATKAIKNLYEFWLRDAELVDFDWPL